MTKFLTAKEKADELGITTSGLAKTRHLYKHIKKSPRKYLYFKEEDRPFKPEAPDTPVISRYRRRNVPFGQTHYSRAPGGSGEKLKRLNQMRAKMALEGRIPKEHRGAFDEAEAYHLEKNYLKINEEKRAKLQHELLQNEERTRKQDPGRYVVMNPRTPLVNLQTPWRTLFPQEKSEYDKALEELQGDTKDKSIY